MSKFAERLKAFGCSTYAEYLASQHWANFRRRYRQAGERMTCLICNARSIQLHHQTYARLGCEQFEDVIPVCRPHHEAIHEWLKSSGKKFVEHTHEAVKALGGECPAPAGRGERRGRKKKKAEQRSPATVGTPDEVQQLVESLKAMSLTKNEMAAVRKFAAKGDVKQLAGFAKSITKRRAKSNDPAKVAKREAAKARERAKQIAREKARRDGRKATTSPLVVANEREKWKDPLYAMRMLAHGHKPPPT